MKGSFFLLITLIQFFFSMVGIAQTKDKEFNVLLKKQTTNIPFKLKGGCFTTLYNGSRKVFDGVPPFLNRQNSIIKTVHFGRAFDVRDSIYMIVGDKNNDTSICIIDANTNHDFSDDHVYIYNRHRLTDTSTFKAQTLHFKYRKNGNMIDCHLNMRPSFFSKPNGLKYGDSLSQKYYVVLFLEECMTGSFRFNKINYKIYAVMPTPRPLYGKGTIFTITKRANRFKNKSKPAFYGLNQPIYVGDDVFMITKIDPIKDSVAMKYMGKRLSMEIGVRKGFYAPEFISKTVNGKVFDLKEYREKYILLDFWGTWCKPCIQSLPYLRKMNKRFKDLVMVSIACEDSNIGILKRAIKKYKLKWINIYEPFKGDQEIIHKFNIGTFPTTLLIDPNGKIIFRGGSKQLPSLYKLIQTIYN